MRCQAVDVSVVPCELEARCSWAWFREHHHREFLAICAGTCGDRSRLSKTRCQYQKTEDWVPWFYRSLLGTERVYQQNRKKRKENHKFVEFKSKLIDKPSHWTVYQVMTRLCSYHRKWRLNLEIKFDFSIFISI